MHTEWFCLWTEMPCRCVLPSCWPSNRLSTCRASPPGSRRTRCAVSRLWWMEMDPKPTGPESWMAMSSYWWAHSNDSSSYWKPLNRLLPRGKNTLNLDKNSEIKIKWLPFRAEDSSTKRKRKRLKCLFENIIIRDRREALVRSVKELICMVCLLRGLLSGRLRRNQMH